ILRQIVQVAKRMHNEGYISDSASKQRATWWIIGEYTGKTPRNVSILSKVTTKDESYVNILNEMNGYCVNSGIFSCDVNTADCAGFRCETSISNCLVFENTDPVDIYNIIMSLKNTKLTGFDDIPVALIKTVAEQISPVLSHIANKMFDREYTLRN
ncbi:hypothetical protein HHI36_014167, partial [Cryptolaemus montrouzieri]